MGHQMPLGATSVVPARKAAALLDLRSVLAAAVVLWADGVLCLCSACQQRNWNQLALTTRVEVVGVAATQSRGGDLRGPDDDLVLPVN